MSISGLIKSIRVGLRSKLFICLFTFVSGYSYCYLDGYVTNPLFKFVSICIFFMASLVMVFVLSNYFFGNMIETIKSLFNVRGKISWVNIPEFTELAERMGVKLHKERPFGIKKGLNNAFTNLLTNQIIFGQDLISKLNKRECLALACHELTHLKENHFMRIFSSLLIVSLLISISLSVTAPPQIIINLICLSAMFITFVFTSWQNELAADARAGKQIGKKPTISLLQKLVSPTKWQYESETHPSIRERISKLQKMK